MSRVADSVTTFVWRRRSDADAFRSALRGDAVAFTEIYRRYHERVYAFCLARLSSPDAAHDAAHETFLRLLTADSDSIRSPGSWLFGVARNVCIDVTRRDSRISDASVESCHATVTHTLSRPAEDEALSNDEARAVLLALRRVRPRYRAALILREIHREPIGAIAESLGVSSGTASTILSRARDAFGRAYAEVLNLENGCCEAVGMVYRRTGSGLTSAEEAALEAHLATCSECRTEADRAGETLSSSAILLLLPVADGPARGIIGRAVEILARDQSLIHVMSTGGTGLDAPVTRVAASVMTAVIAAAVSLGCVSSGPSIPVHDTGGASGNGAVIGCQVAEGPSVAGSIADSGCGDATGSHAGSGDGTRLLHLSASGEPSLAGYGIAYTGCGEAGMTNSYGSDGTTAVGAASGEHTGAGGSESGTGGTTATGDGHTGVTTGGGTVGGSSDGGTATSGSTAGSVDAGGDSGAGGTPGGTSGGHG